jgi:acetoin utilization protein AcuB
MITVEDIMTRKPLTVNPETTLEEVIGLMKSRHCLHMPVVDEGRLVGIITDRDLRLAMNSPLVLHERADDLALLKVATAGVTMTSKPLTISPESPATLAAKLMRKHKFGALPVVAEGKLVGIVTVSDILDNYITILESQASAKTG